MRSSTGDAGSTEDRLREALDTLAGSVEPKPGAYRRVSAEWRRRERRRRLLTALLVLVVLALADLVGLWALNRADPGSSVIFDHNRVVHAPAVPGVGLP